MPLVIPARRFLLSADSTAVGLSWKVIRSCTPFLSLGMHFLQNLKGAPQYRLLATSGSLLSVQYSPFSLSSTVREGRDASEPSVPLCSTKPLRPFLTADSIAADSCAYSSTASTVVIALELIEIVAGAYRFDLSLPVADARRSQELFQSHMNVQLLLEQ